MAFCCAFTSFDILLHSQHFQVIQGNLTLVSSYHFLYLGTT